MRKLGQHAFAAKALRCIARMAIRMNGEAGVLEMEDAKSAFLALGMAGEVCRSTIAVMQELHRMNPKADLTFYAQEIQFEARSLGVLSISLAAIRRLQEVIRTREVTEEILEETWEVFGRLTFFGAMSGVATVRN
jgi:hypothetical protein